MLFVCLFDFHLFGFCLFPFPLRVLDGLRLLIVALSGLFYNMFFLLFLSLYVFACMYW